MNKLSIIVIFLASVMNLQAQSLYVKPVGGGEQVAFSLAEKPKITFSKGTVTVQQTTFQLSNVQNMSFTEIPQVTTSSLPNGTVETAYSQTLTAAGTAPIAWSLESGNLPNGLNLSEDGVISGTPTTAGTFNFIVKANNSIGSNSQELSITIANCVATGTDTKVICGSSYTWIDGNTYTSDNTTAQHILTAANGCDSIVTLNLTLKSIATGTDTKVICGSSYTWIDGNTYTSNNNTAQHTLTAANGCDSIVTLNLTLKPIATGTDTQVICGSSYTWIDGNTYTSNNTTAQHTLTAANGCDSIVTLHLTLHPFVPVTNITDVPVNDAIVGIPLELTGMIEPANATNQSIVWSLVDSGTANGTIYDNDFYATAEGTSVIMASIASGASACTDDYTKIFYITVTNSFTTGIKENVLSYIKIYPNPVNDILFVECENDYTVKLYNMLGKEILTQNGTGKIGINISHLPQGVYNVKVISESGLIGNSKIIKQ